MKKLIPFLLAVMVVVSATVPAQSAITQQQAIQAVRDFIGNQNAQVTMMPGVTDIVQHQPSGSYLDIWAHYDPYYDMTSGIFEFYVNGNTGFIDSVIVTSDLDIYPTDALNSETIWSKYSMLPRSQMVLQETDSWVLQYPDGSWDDGVRLGFNKTDNGLIKQVSVCYTPVPSTRPVITISSQQAISIAQTVAGSYAWLDSGEILHAYPYFDLVRSTGVGWWINQQGQPEPVYNITYLVSSDPNVDASWLDPESTNSVADCARFMVFINAATGSIIYSDGSMYLGGKAHHGAQIGTVRIKQATNIKPTRIVPLLTMQSLAKGHKLSAKAGEKAFTMDGKRIALPAKVVAKSGTLYLPWQALKSLPGVKCSYDAKLNKLDITTTPPVKKVK